MDIGKQREVVPEERLLVIGIRQLAIGLGIHKERQIDEQGLDGKLQLD